MTMAPLLRRLVFAFLLLGMMPASAQKPLEQIVQGMAQVDFFAFGGVGFAGTTSEGEMGFRTVMSEPPDRALALFETLYATGNLQAKGYALVGIRALKPARFKELYKALLTSKDNITTMRGCIVSSEHFSDIVRQIDKGNYDVWLRPKPFAFTPGLFSS